MAGISIIWFIYCILVFKQEPFYLCWSIFGVILYLVFYYKFIFEKPKCSNEKAAQMIRNWEEYKSRKANENK